MQPNGFPQQPQQDPWGGYNEYADLDGFGSQAAPVHDFAPGIATLRDGDYDMQFGACVLDKTEGGKRLVRCAIHAQGRVIEHPYWLNDQRSVNAFLAEMAALGFPAQSWGGKPGQTPLSRAIPAVVGQLEGVRFRACKSSRVAPAQPAQYGQPAREARTFHELYISGRIASAAQPAAPGAQPGAQAPPPPAPAPGVTPAAQALMASSQQPALASAGTDEEIPF